MTVKRLYEQAKRVPVRDQRQLADMLRAGWRKSNDTESFFDNDPLLKEIKTTLASSVDKPFGSLEEAMGWSRGYEWRSSD